MEEKWSFGKMRPLMEPSAWNLLLNVRQHLKD